MENAKPVLSGVSPEDRARLTDVIRRERRGEVGDPLAASLASVLRHCSGYAHALERVTEERAADHFDTPDEERIIRFKDPVQALNSGLFSEAAVARHFRIDAATLTEQVRIGTGK